MGAEEVKFPCTEFLNARDYSHGYYGAACQESACTSWFSPQSSGSIEHEKHYGETEYIQLPNYIQPIPSHITTDDLQFLKGKHALTLPNHKVQTELWMAYWKYAHPCIPVLDQIQMVQSLRDSGEKISMLLYQCIMLVGRLFLNAHESPCYEFPDIREMFTGIRALYDLGWEINPLTIIQSLLLMTYFPQRADESKGQAYFVGHAVSMAYRIGLNRDPANLNIKASLYHLRKRLWWSLFIRERCLVLDQGIPWIINETDYDVSMITIDDFCLTLTCRDIERGGSLVKLSNISRWRKIAIMCIEKAKLAVIIGKLPPVSVHIPGGNSSIFKKPWLQSGQLRDYQSLNYAGISLGRWRRDAASEIDFRGLNSPASWVGDSQLYILCATLRLLYHTVKFQLAVLRVLSIQKKVQLPPEGTCQEVNRNFRIIMQIIGELQLYEQSDQIPLYGTSVLRPVMTWAILNGMIGKNTYQSSNYHHFQYGVYRGDSYWPLFNTYLLCEKE